MNKTELFTYIKNVGYPYWELFIIDGFKANRIRNYKLEDIDSDASPEEKINASVNALEITLSTFAPTVKFKITLKNSETANGSGICGPVEFINQVGEAFVNNIQPGSSSGLGALPDLGKLREFGYISKQEYDAKLDAMKVANDRAIMELELKIQRDNLQRDYDRQREELKKEIEEYRKARENSESSVNKLVEVVKLAAPPILSQLFGIDFEALSGAPGNNQQAGEVEVKDAKYIEVERLATELYDSKATLEDITELRNRLKRSNYGVHPDNPSANSN